MFKSLTLFLGKLFFKSPVVHHFSPKVVNVSFSNSKTNSPVILNLKNVSTIKFVVNLVKSANNPDEYSLIAVIDNSANIELGVFESKKEADDALLLLNIKISNLCKFFAKWAVSIISIIVLLMVAKDLVTIIQTQGAQQVVSKQNTKALDDDAIRKVGNAMGGMSMPGLPGQEQLTAPAQAVQMAPVQAQQDPVLTEAELMDLFMEAQRLTAQQNQVYDQGQGNPNQPVQQPKSAADAFLDQLK